MSGELPHPVDGRRHLRHDETALLEWLLRPFQKLAAGLASAQVIDMNDGGMGSIKFDGADSRRFGNTLLEVKYKDDDGVDVIISVNLDETGRLFELDFWKVDFSPLQSYPTPALTDVQVRSLDQ